MGPTLLLGIYAMTWRDKADEPKDARDAATMKDTIKPNIGIAIGIAIILVENGETMRDEPNGGAIG